MEKRIYAVFDVVAGVVLQDLLFLSPGDGDAARTFSEMVRSRKGPIGARPQDFILVCVGTIRMDLAVLDVVGSQFSLGTPIALGRNIADPRQLELLEELDRWRVANA